MRNALGLIECVGYTAAMAAADAALKAAGVEFFGYETVIGVRQKASVLVKFGGEVAAVSAAVSAGNAAAESVGEVVSVRVIAGPHEQTDKLVFTADTTVSSKEAEAGAQNEVISKPLKKRKN